MASPSGSSAKSFRTAQEGSPRERFGESNDPNSLHPVLDDAKGKDDKDGQEKDVSKDDSRPAALYRPVRDIPYQLRDHIRVFLEEKMYGEAIHLLTSLLAAGGSDGMPLPSTSATTSDTPVWLPPASHLSILASLAVHPAYTTRPTDGTDMRVAGYAMQYLRHVLTMAGPVGAEMASAFEYRDARGQRASTPRAAAARARALASGIGRGRDRIVDRAHASASTSRASSANRPRRQLRAPAGRSSRNTSEYVDSSTLSWSDDEHSGKKGSKPKRRSTAGGGGGGDVEMGSSHDDKNGLGGGDASDNDYAAEDNDEEAVSGRMATRDGVWMRGQSFWRVVAWALACSVREPERWRCWQPWLALMVDVLEADLMERLAWEEGDDEQDDIYGSLLFQYLSDDGGSNSSTHLRHLAAVVLSDGSQPALAREVFDKETVARAETATAATAARPARVLDLDNDKFGDYSDDDESAPSTPESSPSPSPSPSPFAKKKLAPKKKTTASRAAEVSDNPGFLESLPLRRRLFYLVALGSLYFPAAFAATDAVYRAFAEVLREADISVYAAFVAAAPPPSASPLPALLSPDNVFVGLLRHILFTYLPASAPKPHVVDPRAVVTSLPSSRVLARCFLPFAANTVLLGANVRMALALEGLFRIVWQPATGRQDENGDGEEHLWSPALQVAAETGVKARETRARSSTAASSKQQASTLAVEAYGRDLLQRSGRRLLAMVQLARMDAGEPEMVVGDL